MIKEEEGMNKSAIQDSRLSTFNFEILPGVMAMLNEDLIIVDCTATWRTKFTIAENESIFSLPVAARNETLWIKILQKGLSGTDQFYQEENDKNDEVYRWDIKPIYKSGEPFLFIQRVFVKSARSNRIQKLREQANRVAEIGYWEVDLVKDSVYWSNVTRKIHGVPAEYIPKLEGALSFYKEGHSRNKIQKLVQEAVQNGTPYNAELVLISHKEKEVWVNARGEAQFEDGKCVRLLGTFQDISVAKRRELQIQTSEERFRMAFKNTLIAFILVDAHTFKIKDINIAAKAIFGYSRKEFLELRIKDVTHPDDAQDSLAKVKQLINGEIEKLNFETRYIHKNGNVIDARVFVSLTFDEDGVPSTIIAQIQDISELKKKSKEVDKFIDVTTRQNRRLLDFAHIVSHNLRSHTSNIAMLLEFMEKEEEADEREQQFNMLKRASKMLSETIDHLNGVIALDVDKQDKLNLNLNEYLEKMISSIQGHILNNGFKVINDIDSSFTVSAVPAYLESIILNMLTNSIKYRSPDRDSWVRFSAHKKGLQRIITVEDNGRGIDLVRHKKKIFGMYKTFHDHPDSRGLGLYMTKRQIEVMGGEITVESEVNKGTTFKIYLYEKS